MVCENILYLSPLNYHTLVLGPLVVEMIKHHSGPHYVGVLDKALQLVSKYLNHLLFLSLGLLLALRKGLSSRPQLSLLPIQGHMRGQLIFKSKSGSHYVDCLEVSLGVSLHEGKDLAQDRNLLEESLLL